MKNAEVTTNFILKKKTYKLMWQEYDWWYLNNIWCLNQFFFIGDMSISKTYAVEFVMFLASLKEGA